MEPDLRNFIRDLMHHGIRAGIHALFWRMPTFWIVLILAVLIGSVIYFKLYMPGGTGPMLPTQGPVQPVLPH